MAGFQRDTKPYYSLATLLARAVSHTEGSPNVVLEAMAAGLPIAATAVGGVPEILEDGVTGLMVPSRNPDAMARRHPANPNRSGDAPASGSGGTDASRIEFHRPTRTNDRWWSFTATLGRWIRFGRSSALRVSLIDDDLIAYSHAAPRLTSTDPPVPTTQIVPILPERFLPMLGVSTIGRRRDTGHRRRQPTSGIAAVACWKIDRAVRV